jgi:hypothetical protein
MAQYEAGADEASIRKYVIAVMINGGDKNAVQLKSKQNAFRAAAVLLAVEVALLVLVLFLEGLWPWLLCLLDGDYQAPGGAVGARYLNRSIFCDRSDPRSALLRRQVSRSIA